jgi:hypothetical protein
MAEAMFGSGLTLLMAATILNSARAIQMSAHDK